jgi:hypothetical protein
MIRTLIMMAVAAFASSGATANGPMEFRLRGTAGNCTGCEWMAADSNIMPGTPAKFRAYLAFANLTNWKGRHRLELTWRKPACRNAPGELIS